MDWQEWVVGHPDPDFKARFHYEVSHRLTRLATALNLKDEDYDLCSERGEADVSGSIYLYHDKFHIRVTQTGISQGCEITICEGKSRRDRFANAVHYLPIELLDHGPALAALAKNLIEREPRPLMQRIDWHAPIVGHKDPFYKVRFHAEVRDRLARFAGFMQWHPPDYDLYSLRVNNQVSGKTILQTETAHMCVDPSNGHPRGHEVVVRPRDLARTRFADHRRTMSIHYLDDPIRMMLRVDEIIKGWDDAVNLGAAVSLTNVSPAASGSGNLANDQKRDE